MKNTDSLPIIRRNKSSDPDILASSLADIATSIESFPKLSAETNDTARLNRAIASLNNGDTLFIPNKTYIIDPITISNKTIKIIGNGTFKRNAAPSGENGLFYLTGCSSIFIQGITFDNNGFGGVGFYLSACPNFSFDSITVKNMNDTSSSSNVLAIDIKDGSHYGKFNNCKFDQINSAGTSRAVIVSNYNVATNQTIGVEVKNCYFSNMSGGTDNDAVVFDQRGFDGYHRAIDNQFVDIQKRAIKLNVSSSMASRNKAVKNNTGLGYAVISSYGNNNIVMDNEGYGFGTGGWTAGVDTLGSTIIRRNKFVNSPTADNSSNDGISITLDSTLGTFLDSVVVEDNHLENFRFGLRVLSGAPVNKLRINKNRFKGSITGHILYFQSVVTNLIIEGNMADTSPQDFIQCDSLPSAISVFDNHHNAGWGLTGNRISTMTARGNINGTTPDDDYDHGIKITYKTSIPSSGAWITGDKCVNLSPVLGGKEGWVCTASGSPGTWIAYGNITNGKSNFGSGVITAGWVMNTINHGMSGTPSNITVTPQGNIGSVWVSNITSSQFQVNCSATSASDTPIFWRAEM